ncbi:MAG: hypothetical protein HQL18_04250, partial [Candidatus Omnitrophica bacterium]|nr:hypothetical protein [Candidatus Omnitrophota bacterium]
MKKFLLVLLVCAAFGAVGCQMAQEREDQAQATSAPLSEPEWLRNGEPIEFEGELWYPTDEVERLLDLEVFQAAEARG